MEDHGSFSDLDKPGAMEGGLRRKSWDTHV